MALTNAERQARYRARMKAHAAGAGLMNHVDKAVDEAAEALWAFFNRPDPDGQPWADIDGCAGIEDYRAGLTGQLLATCRALLWNGEGLEPHERAAIAKLIEIADRLEMKRPHAG